LSLLFLIWATELQAILSFKLFRGDDKLSVRYVHTNIISEDWRALSKFYQEVFGCIPVPPERSQSGPWLEAGTGVKGAALAGVHLRLPGYGEHGPTLEIYQYSTMKEKPEPAANRKGLGHLAFAVDDVEATLRMIIAGGGRALGRVVTAPVPGAGQIRFVYASDPEGNIIELQRWL
jgi:predicted enzyme related to lactoylglutathione lyase